MTSPKRQRSRAWCFTWNNPDESAVAQLSNSFGSNEWVCQLEIGSEGTPHLQGVMRYKNPRDSVGDDLFSLCHWERCRNWRASVKYCTKVVSRVGGPWTNIEGLKWRETIKSPLLGKELYPWQSEILELIKTEPDDRTIHWYWEPIGCCGKTALAKHIYLMDPERVIYVSGRNKDILFGVGSRLENADIKVAIFGLTRQDYGAASYKSLEQLKDGIFFSGKYESRMHVFNAPHVIVFANFPPIEECLSSDRWRITNIRGRSQQVGI